MTTYLEAKERIYETFDTDFTTTANVTFDNEKYDPPDNTSWVRLAVRHTGRQQESLGPVAGRKFESFGSVFVQCFAPLDTGAKTADTLAQAAQAVFEGKTIGAAERLRFTSVSIVEVGPGEDWHQVNVEAFFTYTETK